MLICIVFNFLRRNTAIEKHQSASIPIDSKTFQEYLLPFDGALQCVFEMGFQVSVRAVSFNFLI